MEGTPGGDRLQRPAPVLSPREIDILGGAARGLPTDCIAAKYGLRLRAGPRRRGIRGHFPPGGRSRDARSVPELWAHAAHVDGRLPAPLPALLVARPSRQALGGARVEARIRFERKPKRARTRD